MTKLIPYSPVLYEDLVEMYIAMFKEVYKDRVTGTRQDFFRDVDSWTRDSNVDIVISVQDGNVSGFTKSYMEYHNGLIEPNYYTQLIYVKPEFRDSRSSFYLINNINKYTIENKLNYSIDARVDNGFSEMIKKHYNANSSFIKFERKG